MTDAGNLLRGCGFAYDVEYPGWSRLPAPPDQFLEFRLAGGVLVREYDRSRIAVRGLERSDG